MHHIETKYKTSLHKDQTYTKLNQHTFPLVATSLLQTDRFGMALASNQGTEKINKDFKKKSMCTDGHHCTEEDGHHWHGQSASG